MKKMLLILFLMLAGVILAGQVITQAQGQKDVPKETLEAVGPQLATTFTFEPFNPSMPDHLWMKADSGMIIFLHFAKPVSDKGNKLIFVGEGIKGRFCAEDQPDKGKTGYVHFHASTVVKGHEHGHGGDKGQEGFWLRHVAVDEFDMMGMHFKPGVAYNFMPTQAPKCK
ncbi:MAG: hypothetical protein AAB266_02365 [Nitrospirota bacterium]